MKRSHLDEQSNNDSKRLSPITKSNDQPEFALTENVGARTDINQLDENGMTLLHKASQAGNLLEVISLLQQGADVYATGKSGWAAVHYAAWEGYQEIIQHLVQNDAYINVKDDSGATALDIAAQNGHTTLVNYLIEATPAIVSFQTIQRAIAEDHFEIVKYLIYKISDINEQNSEGVSYLHTACSQGNLLIVKLLVEHGSKIDIKDKNFWTPLQFSAQIGHLEAVKYLVLNGAKINPEPLMGSPFAYLYNQSTPLHHAAGNGHLNVVEYLVAAGADIHRVDAYGINAFMNATRIGSTEVADFLIANGARINDRDKYGNTALHNCVDNFSMLQYLVERGANLNMKNYQGRTVLHRVVDGGGSLEMVQYLVNKGIEVNLKDLAQDSALQYAIRTGNLKIVQYLLQSGAEVSALIYRSMQYKFQNFAKKISKALLFRANRLLDRAPTIPSNMLLADLYEVAPVTALQVRAEALMTSKRFSEANDCSLRLFEHKSASESDKKAAADAIVMYHISPVNNGIEDAALENARDRSLRYIKALEYAVAGTQTTLSLVLDYFQETKDGPNSAQFAQDLTAYYNNRTSLDLASVAQLSNVVAEFGVGGADLEFDASARGLDCYL